jgi:cellulose synthase/poly-beta-1,6-N-acetylglucosamine synthase-like glycosyltransferase
LAPHFERSSDYTIVVPLYGHPRYFADRDHLRREQANVLVALDPRGPGMRALARELETEGWRVALATPDEPSPPTLIAAVLDQVDTRYLVRMDADTRCLEDIGRYVAAMERAGADVASTKVEVAEAHGIARRFQQLEYRMAMLSRHYRPWLTSGACTVATTAAWRAIFAFHSMWSPGEDIETGRVAFALKLRVRHLDLSVETEAPASWRALFRQRRLWWAGNFRHTIVNFDKNAVQLPVWSFYYLGLVWLGVYFKWDSLIGYLQPFVLLQALFALFVVYALVTIVANWQVRSWGMLVYPPYALLQAILMPTVGSVYYVKLARSYGRLGRYRVGYRRRALARA